MTTRTFKVEGMTCGGCVRHVEKALRTTPGVTEVAVDLTQGTATVSGAAAPELLSARIAAAGYQLIVTD